MSNDVLLYSNLLLWLVVLVLGAVVFGMVRQIGVLHERVAPMGALANDRGPDVGEMAPDMKIAGTAGPIAAIGWRHTADEQPGDFHVNTTVGSSQLFDPEGGGPAKAAYLHALFEIPDSEEPARYDWKQRTRPLVKRLTPAQN